MEVEEPLELFGAQRGCVQRAVIALNPNVAGEGWYISLDITTVMRKKPMTIWVQQKGDQDFDRPLGLFTQIVHGVKHSPVEYTRQRMVKAVRDLSRMGYDVDYAGIGGAKIGR